MDLHGKNVHSLAQQPRAEERGKCRATIIIGRGRCQRAVSNGAARHVEAAHFRSIQVNHRAVVTLQVHQDCHELRHVVGNKRLPIIRGYKLVRCIRTKGIGRQRLPSIGISVAQRRWSARPQTVVEIRPNPTGALIAAVIQILPDRVGRHQCLRHRNVHRLRAVGSPAIGGAHRCEPV